MGNVGCRIKKEIKRPNANLLDLFKGIPVANIDDSMNRCAAADGEIRPFNKNHILGPAFTVKVAEGDNLMFHKALTMAQKGDVIVIDAGGYKGRAICGALMISYAQSIGLGGVIVDGAVRDCEDLANMDIPVYARAVTPNGPYKNGPGEIGFPVSFGGKVVNPGDIVVADGDGIVFINPDDAEEIAEKAKAVVEKEAKIMQGIKVGDYHKPWLQKKLDEIGCEEI